MTEPKLDVAKELGHIALEAIDLEKLAVGIIDRLLEPALDNLVASTATPVDDAIKAVVYGPLEAELKKLIAKEIADLKAKIA